jgi:hypothetical protein
MLRELYLAAAGMMDGHHRFEAHGGVQRARHEAAILGLLKQLPRRCLVGVRRNAEAGAQLDLREADDAVLALEPSRRVALERRPRQLRRARDSAERQDETVRDRADEERLRRPALSRTVELGRRRRRKRRHALDAQMHVAVQRGDGGHVVMMGKRLHETSQSMNADREMQNRGQR